LGCVGCGVKYVLEEAIVLRIQDTCIDLAAGKISIIAGDGIFLAIQEDQIGVINAECLNAQC
jgi:exosome complex RNA-binding protein Csl4